ncbi:biotin--[acetyl-CoA-carboxylase] ligase [Alphaproteobacteria bacterium]|nr:biotin--[acetyl-CoA-carboxylase] ligase [Alphaproteobacteria bacterium]
MRIIKFNIIDSTHSYALKLINLSHNLPLSGLFVVDPVLESSCTSKYTPVLRSVSPKKSSDIVGSTKDLINGSVECAIIADRQTKGIGRCNREWISDSGNLFVSIIKWLPPNVDVGKISLTIACAVRDTIAHFVGDSSDLTLHWPNDVYHRDRKISGILIAVAGEWMVISVGINVNSAPQHDVGSTNNKKHVLQAPTSIADVLSSRDIPTMSVFNILITNVDKWLLLLEKSDFSSIRSYWLQNINGIKCNVVVKNGVESLSGLFYDLDESGRLVLEKNGKYLFISSGDLFLNQEGIVISNEEKI